MQARAQSEESDEGQEGVSSFNRKIYTDDVETDGFVGNAIERMRQPRQRRRWQPPLQTHVCIVRKMLMACARVALTH